MLPDTHCTPENPFSHEQTRVLEVRGIPVAFALSHGLRPIDGSAEKSFYEKYGKWGYKPDHPGLPLIRGSTGILMQYQECLDRIGRARIRVDCQTVTIPGPYEQNPDEGATEEEIPRYLCQAGVSVVPYIPPEVFAVSADTSIPLFITEAPLKALSLTAHGFISVGLGGVLAGATAPMDVERFSLHRNRDLHPELARIDWRGRPAYIVFDANISDPRKPLVALGAARLILALSDPRIGADVRVVLIPYHEARDNDIAAGRYARPEDQGPDDFITRNGADAFLKLVEASIHGDLRALLAEAKSPTDLLTMPIVGALLHEGGDILKARVAGTNGIGARVLNQVRKEFAERLSRSTAEGAEVEKRPFMIGDEAEAGQRLVDDLTGGHPDLAVYDRAVLHVYDGERGTFGTIEKDALVSRVADYSGSAQANGTPLRVSHGFCQGSVSIACSKRSKLGYFDKAPTGIAFRNRFLQVYFDGPKPSIEFHPGNSEANRARHRYEFDFEPQRARLHEDLRSLIVRPFADDQDFVLKHDAIQEFVGASIFGCATRFQRMMIFVGVPNAGKSTLARLIEKAMPLGSVSHVAPQMFNDPPWRACLDGIRLNLVYETPEDELVDGSAMKAIVVGDRVQAKRLYKDPYDFTPSAGHLLLCNRLFRVRDPDPAFRRRLLVVKFNKPLEKDDVIREFEKTIEERIPDLVAWAVEGLARLMGRGDYTIPPSSEVAIDEWLSENNSIALFINDALDHLDPKSDKHTWMTPDELYQTYDCWCSRNGHKHPYSSDKFWKRLEERVVKGRLTEGARYAAKVKGTQVMPWPTSSASDDWTGVLPVSRGDNFACHGCRKTVPYDDLFVFRTGHEPAYLVNGIPYCSGCAHVENLKLLSRENVWELIVRDFLDDA